MEKAPTPSSSRSEHKKNDHFDRDNQEKLSIVSIVCRICYDDKKNEPIITPCRCKGTVAFIHRSCLETWLAESNTNTCELCHHEYRTERTPRYSAKSSIWQWFRHQPSNLGVDVRGLRSDLFACAVLTPLAVVITYVCLFSADYYNQQKFSNVPAARWTSVSLLIMISIILIGYYLWVYMVTRYHGRLWYFWWQRECVVRYIPPSTVQELEENLNEHDLEEFNSSLSDNSQISETRNASPVSVVSDHNNNNGEVVPVPVVPRPRQDVVFYLNEIPIRRLYGVGDEQTEPPPEDCDEGTSEGEGSG